MKKIGIIIGIVILLVGGFLLIKNINSNKNNEVSNNNTSNSNIKDENPIEYNIPVSYKYDDKKQKLYLYMNNKLVKYDDNNYPDSFDAFRNVSLNNIIYNVRYKDKITLDAVTVEGDYVIEVTKLINSFYKYSGNYLFDNNTINLYYINDNACLASDDSVIGKIYHINTVKDKFTLLEDESDLIKSDYVNAFVNAC